MHSLDIFDPGLSDHYAVHCMLKLPKPEVKRNFTFRKFKNIDLASFIDDVSSTSLISNPADDPDMLIIQYNDTLRDLVNTHAPLITREA